MNKLGFLVLFAIILLAKWTTLVQLGSQSLPAEKKFGPLRCGEKCVGDNLECGRNIDVNAQEKIAFVMWAVKVFKLEFFLLKSQLLEVTTSGSD